VPAECHDIEFAIVGRSLYAVIAGKFRAREFGERARARRQGVNRPSLFTIYKVSNGSSPARQFRDQNRAVGKAGDGVCRNALGQHDATVPGERRHIAARIDRENFDALASSVIGRIEGVQAAVRNPQADALHVECFWIRRGRAPVEGAAVVNLLGAARVPGAQRQRVGVNELETCAIAVSTGNEPARPRDMSKIFRFRRAANKV
jgi:hypothetical protein